MHVASGTAGSHENILTLGDGSTGIMSQSVGGGGGDGGFSISISGGGSMAAASVGIGGTGAGGGNAAQSKVDSFGDITTVGAQADGIISQSVGGGRR